MKKWISVGAGLLIVLTVVGMVTFNNKVEKSQADIEGMERVGNEKGGLLQAEENPSSEELPDKERTEGSASGSDGEQKGEGEDGEAKGSTAASAKGGQDDSSEEGKSSLEDSTGSSNGSLDGREAGNGERSSGQNSSDSSRSSSSGQPNNSSAGDSSGSSSNGGNSSRSANAILDEYESDFRSMESEYQGRLNNLVQEAYDEYMEDGTVNEASYKSRARSLESETDSAFYSKYNQLQSELQSNGHSPSKAVPLKNEYENKKEATRADLESFVQ